MKRHLSECRRDSNRTIQMLKNEVRIVKLFINKAKVTYGIYWLWKIMSQEHLDAYSTHLMLGIFSENNVKNMSQEYERKGSQYADEVVSLV